MVENGFEQARFNMVEQQIRPWDVFDPLVLGQFLTLPRDVFVPNAYKGLAYADIEIPLAHGQAMMFPRMEARLIQILAIQPEDQVLEVGTGSGFLSACLAKLANRVVSIDIHKDFTEMAERNLDALEIRNVLLRTSDAMTTPSPDGPFDAIAVTGSVPTSAQAEIFRQQLKPGGRLFIIIGTAPVMEAWLITRESETTFREEIILETEQVPLESTTQPEAFEF
ncbi:MAG: protein-L-isoaspartate O-methyltransferase [gamma proteobacterium endosymbiont of Lamellibrachia anaximandri]|nr:protein-L-isoaspartate O-methyltransferase [gamma proteobacterium endosymbiont of Lamellibrachia anaximandri]MBL3532803.1 protein-L-isoaspartate O-methyltransferase [gamma proteobacterium endosymbiont of Lamellibrachia anaximandri]MBL3601071.1 protein-L-isoaspartate O-methyltransferase [gamma proteobacterium endosymbiont of Lamellibrachia anaximandri]